MANGVSRYCTQPECLGGALCKQQTPENCSYEYVAEKLEPHHRWRGEGPPPYRWRAPDGTMVYRTFADYCD